MFPLLVRSLLLVPVCLLAGCTSQTDNLPEQAAAVADQDSPQTESTQTATPSTPETSDEEMEQTKSAEQQIWEREFVTLKTATWPEVQAEVAQHKGKVVVVDLWSTWCLPCIRELPHLIQLQQDYPDDVVCISVNMNYDGRGEPAKVAPEVLDFLVDKQAKLVNFLSVTPDMKIYETLDLASIPVAFVYNADGSLAKRFDNEQNEYGDEGFTYEKQIRPMVEELVK